MPSAYIKRRVGIDTVILLQTCQVNKDGCRSHGGPSGILNKITDSGKPVMIDIIEHRLGKGFKRPREES